MQAPLEICYAGVVIARSEEVREGEGGELFVVMKDPLPVGTLVGLRSADELVSVRVLHVVESADGAGSGMQVRPARSDEAGAAMWIPPPPPAKPASTAATQSPAAVAPPASDEPAQAAAVESASENSAAAPTEQSVPAGESATEAVEREAPAPAQSVSPPASSVEQAADDASVGEKPVAAETAPAEPAADAGSTDSVAVSKAVPVAVGSSLTGALEGAAARDPEAASVTVEASDESPGSGEVAAPIAGDLPPARPVQGSGGRRRTKRRR